MGGRQRHGGNWPFDSQMERALAEARAAADRGEVPVGAAIAGPDGILIASAGNRVRELGDPTAHAEMLAIREACRVLGRPRLEGCSMHVTLEPCAMCAMAISLARIERLYFAASDPKSGGVEHGARVYDHPQSHHAPSVYSGIGEAESSRLLKAFFAGLRQRRAN